MLKHESDLLRFSELPEEKIERCWAHFEFEGQPFKARYFVFGDPRKKTLLLTGGFNQSVLLYCTSYKYLAVNFRVIAFDALSNGSNTKVNESQGTQSEEQARQCLISWYEAFFACIDKLLPPKYCVFVASGSCYPVGLWACKHPERIEKLFFASPAGLEYGPAPDKYKRRGTTDSRRFYPKIAVDTYEELE